MVFPAGDAVGANEVARVP